MRDLINDFRFVSRRDGAVWVTLDIRRLPDYVQPMAIVQEARPWVLVQSSGGAVERWFRRTSPSHHFRRGA